MTKGDKTSAADENDAAIEQVSNDTGEATMRESRPGQLTAADLLRSELDGDVKIRRAKKSKNVAYGICHILATFNNTKVSFSDKAGAVISWSSAGKNNFRGSRKSTAYAAQVAVQDAARTAMSHGLKEIDVRIKGPGLGRDAAVRALQNIGLQVNTITDVTPLPHNGCRPKKPRRA
jgi:small subunit ribosomal protein S11